MDEEGGTRTDESKAFHSGGQTDARMRLITTFVSSAVLAWTAYKTRGPNHALKLGLAEGPDEHQAL